MIVKEEFSADANVLISRFILFIKDINIENKMARSVSLFIVTNTSEIDFM